MTKRGEEKDKKKCFTANRKKMLCIILYTVGRFACMFYYRTYNKCIMHEGAGHEVEYVRQSLSIGIEGESIMYSDRKFTCKKVNYY